MGMIGILLTEKRYRDWNKRRKGVKKEVTTIKHGIIANIKPKYIIISVLRPRFKYSVRQSNVFQLLTKIGEVKKIKI